VLLPCDFYWCPDDDGAAHFLMATGRARSRAGAGGEVGLGGGVVLEQTFLNLYPPNA